MDLIQRALREEAAMNQLLEELEPLVYRIAYYLTHHQQDAEDLAQDVLLKICTKLQLYRGDSAFQSWVYTLVVNGHRDLLRKRKRGSTYELPTNVAIGGFESTMDTKMVMESFVDELQDLDRHIFVLRFLQELPVKEVAKIVGLNEGAVKTRLFRLRDRFRQVLLVGGEAL